MGVKLGLSHRGKNRALGRMYGPTKEEVTGGWRRLKWIHQANDRDRW